MKHIKRENPIYLLAGQFPGPAPPSRLSPGHHDSDGLLGNRSPSSLSGHPLWPRANMGPEMPGGFCSVCWCGYLCEAGCRSYLDGTLTPSWTSHPPGPLDDRRGYQHMHQGWSTNLNASTMVLGDPVGPSSKKKAKPKLNIKSKSGIWQSRHKKSMVRFVLRKDNDRIQKPRDY
jgi:hypothetical protein